MTGISQKRRTVLILVIIFMLCVFLLHAARNIQIKKEAEFESRYELWQARNTEVEDRIKGYIDNVDWVYYINQFGDAVNWLGN